MSNAEAKTTIEGIAKSWSQKALSGDWEKTIVDPEKWPYHDLAYPKFLEVASRQLALRPQTSVLDIGCGDCRMWPIFIDHCHPDNLYGVDVASGMLSEAQRLHPFINPNKLFNTDALEISRFLPSNLKFSTILSRGVLVNHLYDVSPDHWWRIVETCHSLLADNGVFIFDFINSIWFAKKRQAEESVFVPDKKLFSPAEIVDLLDQTSFQGSFLTIHDFNGRDPIVVVQSQPPRK